jgi:hypothetical protein
MTFEEFRKSGDGPAALPPPGLSLALQAMWHDAHGGWERAHELAQNDKTREGSWVHAYLHRKEGDTGNAAYWYSRAGRSIAGGTVEEEWEAIVRELLG